METQALTYVLAVNAETPKSHMNHYEANAQDLYNALADALHGSPELEALECSEIPASESDVFYEFDLPDDNTIYRMFFWGTIDREGIEQLARAGWLSGPQCETMGIMTGLGILPAVSIEQEMPYTYASVYVCPLYNGAVPSEPSFHRATRTLRNL
jgi:hypothetical protein